MRILRYAIVGGICFVIDLGCLLLLVDRLPLVAANTIAFVVANVVNFWLGHVWVFEQRLRGHCEAVRCVAPYCRLRYKNIVAQALSMRLPPADVAIIDRAAKLRGRSRTDFVREAAVRAAEEVVLEQALMQMSPRGFAQFVAAIAKPGRPVKQLVRLFERQAPWEKNRKKP